LGAPPRRLFGAGEAEGYPLFPAGKFEVGDGYKRVHNDRSMNAQRHSSLETQGNRPACGERHLKELLCLSMLLGLLTAWGLCSSQGAPAVTEVTNTPGSPTAVDPIWVTAQVTDTVSIATVTLTYSTDTASYHTNTVFLETMAAIAVKPWTGSGCDNAWTVTGNSFEQRTNSSYGAGNPCGLQFKQGTISLTDSMLATTPGIDARGTAGALEFYVAALGVTPNTAWTCQLDAGTGYVTRLSEQPSTAHSYQVYHYDLLPSELVSNLFLRFQFAGGSSNDRVNLDQISLRVVTGGSGVRHEAMYDDGGHQDGAAGDGVYGGQIPAFPAGTSVSYYVTATDASGLSTTNPTGAPGRAYAYTVTNSAQNNIYYNVLLGRPTDHSIAVSVLSSNNLDAYIAYGTQDGVYGNQTTTNSIAAGTPAVITLDSLAAGQQYFYRLYYRRSGGGPFSAAADRPFHTQRPPGDTFTFIIEADPHYLDNEPPVWQRALTNMLADNPDFLVDLGDTFMGEKYYSTNSYTLSLPGIYDACRNVRNQFFSLAGHSIPLFLVNGNHDPELGWFLAPSQPTSNPPVWADHAREFNYPCPMPGAFYSGSTKADPYLGSDTRDAFYAFQWGDALFVMLDNFWYSWQGTSKSKDPWDWTLGTNQYQWLKRTLDTSEARFKFVFAHHLVGGSFAPANLNDARGGLTSAPYFEWGGLNTNGTWGFAAHRPGWPMPIQSLLLSNGVNVVFHGHDHLFVREDLDADGDGTTDLVYQECPQPSRANYNSTGAAAGYGYTSYTALQGNSGYLRVQVTPTNSTVDYVRVYLPVDEGGGKTNRMVTYSYALNALSITGTTNTPVAPTVTNSVWVTSRMSGSTNISRVTLTYDAGAGPTNVNMYDDGTHQDGGNGDSVFGAQIPALPDGTHVRYYVHASYDLNRQAADPSGAPAQYYSYTVLSSIPVIPLSGSVVLGCPTDHSIVANILSTTSVQFYLEYGLAPGVYPYQSATTNAPAGSPVGIVLTPLASNTRYYYRLRYKGASDTSYLADTMHTFVTQRPPGSTFTFCVQGDSHPERVNTMFNSDLYSRTLRTAAADQPDFYVCIGDDFSVDQIPTNQINDALVTARYTLQRPYLGLIGNSSPVFLVNGNHEQAAAYLLDGTSNNIAVWAQNARNRYYPEPAPDGFYSGNTNPVPFIGLLRNYYAWTWGDALFVTIDPYWGCPICVDNNYWTGVKRTNLWDVTHGDAQYQWLKQTLEQSKATYKFVFAHHVLGTGRGGTDEAPLYEWGGENSNGSWGFAANRPLWPVPIHQLMVANQVTAFIQGHDHLWVQQQLDGVTYQTLPNPADPNYATNNADAYATGVKLPNTGYTRFSVAPSGVKVDYVRTYLPADEGPGKTNGLVAYRYTLMPIDSAGDGIPDWWRAQYFGRSGTTTNALSCSTCDPDHDGVDNYHEYIADTNPTNALSYFHILGVSNSVGLAVSYPSSASRLYTLYCRTNLISGGWTNIPSQADVRGSGGLDTLTDPSPSSGQRFYRIGVRVP